MLNSFPLFVLVLKCDASVVLFLSDEPRQNQGVGLIDHKLRRNVDVTTKCLRNKSRTKGDVLWTSF